MAVTEIHAVKSTPEKTLAYVARPEKTDSGALIFSHQCSTDWKTAHVQMQSLRRRFGKDKKILMHHGSVSFKGQELSFDKALEYAQEWMEKKFSGYQYFGSVHQDTDNVHFNFVINAVSLAGKKYNGCTENLNDLRAWTDELCQQYNLSVVIPKNKGKCYKEWMEEKNHNSWKAEIKDDIDVAVKTADSFEQFLELMKKQGYYIKHGDRVEHIVFKKRGMERGCRGRKIGVAYTEEAIRDRIRFKEFDFNPQEIRLRKPDKYWSSLQRELRSLEFRRPKLSTTIALGMHLLAGTQKEAVRKTGKQNKKHVNSQYDHKIQELADQLFFIRKNGISSRADIQLRLAELAFQKSQGGTAEELRQIEKSMKAFGGLLRTLDQIRDRDLTRELLQTNRGKHGQTIKKSEKEK